jgi:hypothetical protein
MRTPTSKTFRLLRDGRLVAVDRRASRKRHHHYVTVVQD